MSQKQNHLITRVGSNAPAGKLGGCFPVKMAAVNWWRPIGDCLVFAMSGIPDPT
jgi:hypothetical protein